MPSGRIGFACCVHQYCYCREKKYYPFTVPREFAYRIEAKENAPERLRRGLSRAAVDIVATGDYQAAEKKFGLSRRMLEAAQANELLESGQVVGNVVLVAPELL